MKNLTYFLLASFCLMSGAQAFPNDAHLLKPQYVFSPKGFDTNDNAQIVLAGSFSDYCTKVGTTRHRVDIAKKKIYIEQTYSASSHCDHNIEMYIPYSIEVTLGTLAAGTYEVMVLNQDRKYTLLSTLPIAEAKNNDQGLTDERLYAPMSSIEFKTTDGANPKLTIRGVFTNSCLSLSKVETHLRAGDVFEVLPIAFNRKSNCVPTLQPFVQTIDLTDFPTGNTLIHVRSMNGQSINKVITTLDRLRTE